MDRRGFLSSFMPPVDLKSAGHGQSQRVLSTGLEPWVPTTTEPWDEVRAGHLLRRTTFMPRWEDIDAAVKMTYSEAVDMLLNTPSNPAPPSMADSSTESLGGLDIVTQNQVRAKWRSDASALRTWLVNVNVANGLSLAEKMAFFWSGHFTSEFENDLEFVIAPLLYRQNNLFRYGGLANFKDLVFNVTLDPAMLVYLGGDLNFVGKPNENFARELMELYTMGIGHYTEGDIKEAARVLTGWRVAQFHDLPAPNGLFNAYFDPAKHDVNAKQYFGDTIPARNTATNTEFLVKKEEVRTLIDILFKYRSAETAKYISRKIYRFFVYSNPSKSDEAVIAAMAQLMLDSNFEIKPVMTALLKSAHFFDNQNIGAQIKTPAELMIGMARQFSYTAASVPGAMTNIDQTIFDPPNVSGWNGWHEWITTNTYPVRSTLATTALQGMSSTTLVSFIKQFPDYDNVQKLVVHLGALLLPRPLSSTRKDAFVKILINNGPGDYVWQQAITNNPNDAAGYMKNLLETIVQLPDFQLC
jgi:uncharacterized protein (DUF1800 family)